MTFGFAIAYFGVSSYWPCLHNVTTVMETVNNKVSKTFVNLIQMYITNLNIYYCIEVPAANWAEASDAGWVWDWLLPCTEPPRWLLT